MTEHWVTRRLPDFLPWLGGADQKILAQVPLERTRFVQMALILLTTSGIAMASMIFALHDGVKVPTAVAAIGGIFWGFIILNLDRFLVLSMGAIRAGRSLALMAVPRLLLASVISIVIATPLTLRVFQHDINVQIAKSQAEQSKQLNTLVSHSGPAQQARKVKSEINQDEDILAGHLPMAVTNPALQDAQKEVKTLRPEVAAAQQKEIEERAAYQCEVDGSGPGCAGASRKVGYGPIAQAKKAQYQVAFAKYRLLESQLQAAEKNLSTAQQRVAGAQKKTLAHDQEEAQKALPGLKKYYAMLERQVQKARNNAQAAVKNDNGILAQLSGLSAAAAGNPILAFAQFLVTALFFLIEILPVTVKFLLNMGEKTTYETVAQAEERKIVDRAKQSRITARRDAERESDEQRRTRDSESLKRINAAEDMNRREQGLSIRANDHVAKEMEAILDVALRDWSNQVRAAIGSSPQAGNGPGATGNGQQAQSSQTGKSAARNPGAISGDGSSAGHLPPVVSPPAQDFGLPEDDDLLA